MVENSSLRKWAFSRCLFGRSPQKLPPIPIRRRKSRAEANAARQAAVVMRTSRRVMLETPTPNHPSPSKDELKLQISVLKQEVQTHTEVVTTLVRQNDQEITDHKAALKAQSYQKARVRSIQAQLLQASHHDHGPATTPTRTTDPSQPSENTTIKGDEKGYLKTRKIKKISQSLHAVLMNSFKASPKTVLGAFFKHNSTLLYELVKNNEQARQKISCCPDQTQHAFPSHTPGSPTCFASANYSGT